MATSSSTQTPRRAPQRATAGTTTSTTKTRAVVAAPSAVAADTDAELVPRFLNFLLPAVISAASSVLPDVGGAIGGLLGNEKAGKDIGGFLGGLFGGRAAPPMDVLVATTQLNRAVEQHQALQVITQLTQQCAPAIIEAMRQTTQERASRGEQGDLDDESMERSWGFLTSVISDAVIKFAPVAIQAATKALGGIVGSRSVDEYAPLLVDTEMTHRFVLPSLSAILSGVQSTLPQLFSLLTGAPRDTYASSRDIAVGWQDFAQTKRLPDNDNIEVLSLTPIDNPNEIEFVLEQAPHKDWWKGLELQDDNGGFITEIGVEGRTKVASVRVAADQLLAPGGYVVLKKAKLFGVHTGMYRLPTAGQNQLRGQQVHFYWYAD
jgi:hypothetical protein